MNSKLLLLFGVALLSVATNGAPVAKETDESEDIFYTEFMKLREIDNEMRDIFAKFVSLCFCLSIDQKLPYF